MLRTVCSLIALAAVTAVAFTTGPSAATAQSSDEALTAAAWVTPPYLRVEYQAQPRARGGSELTGYVYNDYGQPASNVWLDITELDQAGQPIGQITRRVDDLIPPMGRAYFDVRVPTSASYQVVPQAGEFVEGFGGNGG
jgi:hypothetical protein